MQRALIGVFLVLLSPAAAQDSVPVFQYEPFSTCFANFTDEGVVELAFRVTAEGRIDTVRIVKSSGNATLDQRTARCITEHHYKPATRNGVPVAVEWHERIAWVTDDKTDPGKQRKHIEIGGDGRPPAPPAPGAITSPMSIGAPHICMQDYPAEAVRLGIQGTTTVAFTITVQGTTANLHIQKSSGDQSLDEAALTCAARWLYKPAIKNGQPVAVPWKADVKWALH